MENKIQNVYILRHGQTNYNLENRIQGQTNSESILTPEAELEAMKIPSYFINNNITIHKIISSDLLRAKQTAYIINKHKMIDIEFTEELRERGLGDLEGKISSEIGILQSNEQDIYKLNNEEPLQTAENMEKVKARLGTLINRMVESDKTNFLLIGHEWINSYLLNILLDEDLIFHRQRNLQVNHIKIENGKGKKTSLRKNVFNN